MKIPVLLLGAVAGAGSVAMAGPTFLVKQGGVVKGYVSAFDAPSYTLAQFYNYDANSGGPKFFGRAGIFSDADIAGVGNNGLSILMVNASDGLGIVIIGGDGASNAGDSSNFYADMLVKYSAGSFAGNLVVEDDNNESGVDGNGDIYFDAHWIGRWTDGFAAKLANGFVVGDMVTIQKNTSGQNTIGNTAVHGKNGSLSNTDYQDGSGDIILTIVPLPSAVGMAGIGLFGLGVRRRRVSL